MEVDDRMETFRVYILGINSIFQYYFQYKFSRENYNQITISHTSTLEGSSEDNFRRHKIAIILEQILKHEYSSLSNWIIQIHITPRHFAVFTIWITMHLLNIYNLNVKQ